MATVSPSLEPAPFATERLRHNGQGREGRQRSCNTDSTLPAGSANHAM